MLRVQLEHLGLFTGCGNPIWCASLLFTAGHATLYDLLKVVLSILDAKSKVDFAHGAQHSALQGGWGFCDLSGPSGVLGLQPACFRAVCPRGCSWACCWASLCSACFAAGLVGLDDPEAVL